MFTFECIKKAEQQRTLIQLSGGIVAFDHCFELMCLIRIYAHFQLNFANTKTRAIQTNVDTVFFSFMCMCHFNAHLMCSMRISEFH